MAGKRKPVHPVTAYARKVVAGKIVAGPHVRAECRRHIADLKRKDIYFDEAAADRVFAFFADYLTLSDGQFDGLPFILAPPQQFIVGSIFGWKMTDSGRRRFRRAYIEQGKGNGKTPMAAGIGLYGLMADGETGAEIYAAATTRDQASILFQDAVRMAARSVLGKRLAEAGKNPVWRLNYLRKASFFRPLSRNTKMTGSGYRPHFVLADEIHEMPDRGILEILERGFKFRQQPLVLMITNSGSDRNSICYEEHDHAVKVAHGDIKDDTTFSYVCALDPGDDPLTDPACWIKVNPLLGSVITEDYLAGVAKQALDSPGKRNGILRLHFCVWTDAETAWMAREAIEAVEDETLDIADYMDTAPLWCGLDLSATKDITGLALVFGDGETEDGRPKFALFAVGYTPGATLLARERNDKAPYSVWVDDGHLIATDGPVVRMDQLAADLVSLSQRGDLRALAYDVHLYKHLDKELDELGATLNTVEHPQGINRRKNVPLYMPDSIDQFENLVLEKRMRIAVNPALRSAIACTALWLSPAGLRRISKQKATGRIDLAAAAVMAVGAAMADDELQGPRSPWDDPDYSILEDEEA